jgi:Dehydrogenase E1 component/Transketolase, pyrimidine binding domain
MLHAGFDLSRNGLDVCLLSEKGELVEEFAAPGDHDDVCGLAVRKRQVAALHQSMTWFGDGATANGQWHEAMNVAGIRQLPLVFVFENNQWAYSTPNEKSSRARPIGRWSSRCRTRPPPPKVCSPTWTRRWATDMRHGHGGLARRPAVHEVTYLQAISDGLREEMRADESVFCLGEDIGAFGGAFKITDGFIEEFGEDRVWDTPLAENAIIGAAMAPQWRAFDRCARCSSPTSYPADSTSS